MSVIALPLPTDQLQLPPRCVVTGRRAGVQQRATPVHVLGPPRRILLPTTRDGVQRLVRRNRQAWAILAGTVGVSGGSAVALAGAWPGAGAFVGLIGILLGVVAARQWRRRETHAVLIRDGVVALEVPDPEAARELSAMVQMADLPADTVEELQDVRELGTMMARPREVGDASAQAVER